MKRNDEQTVASDSTEDGIGELHRRLLWRRGRRRRSGQRAGFTAVGGVVAIAAAIMAVSGVNGDSGSVPSDAVAIGDAPENSADPQLRPSDSQEFETNVAAWSNDSRDGATQVEHYDGLEEIVEWASVVAVGRIVSVDEPYVFHSEENDYDTYSIPRTTFRVEEVLSGEFDGDAPLDITVWWPSSWVDEDWVSDTSMIVFLRDYADPHGPEAGDVGVHPDEVGAYRLVSSQGILTASPDGEVVAPKIEDEESMFTRSEGAAPDDPEVGDPVLREVRDRGLSIEELVDVLTELGEERVRPW